MSDKTFTDQEVQALVTAAVAEATKDLSKELDDVKASQTVSEFESKVAQAQADADAKVEEIQAQLDAKVIEAEAAKTAFEELTTFLTTESARIDAEAAASARSEERVKAVAEAATFPDEYLTANTDRWASMDDAAFESLLADYKSMGEKTAAGDKGIPKGTALQATRETKGNGAASAAIEVMRLRGTGSDPRTLVR